MFVQNCLHLILIDSELRVSEFLEFVRRWRKDAPYAGKREPLALTALEGHVLD
jgi:hypothetical protein